MAELAEIESQNAALLNALTILLPVAEDHERELRKLGRRSRGRWAFTIARDAIAAHRDIDEVRNAG